MESITEQRREQAIKRIKAKNAFKIHLMVYLTVKTMLVVIWVALAAAGWLHYVVMALLVIAATWGRLSYQRDRRSTALPAPVTDQVQGAPSDGFHQP
jgi:hypothetical protein